MPTKQTFWEVRLSDAAKADLQNIINWTADHFGDRQAETYSEIVYDALEALEDGPDVVGVRVHDDLPKGILTLHAARSGKKARHVILFRAEPPRSGKIIQVLRIPHDSMDLFRHVGQD
ncbi:MAG: type II toxin-antitoxin system RelE/ParE family toxin, partial [Rhodospirillales bacterium]